MTDESYKIRQNEKQREYRFRHRNDPRYKKQRADSDKRYRAKYSDKIRLRKQKWRLANLEHVGDDVAVLGPESVLL